MEQVNINVTKVEQDVTINATPNVTQIIVTTQNGGGTQNLNDVLSEGNETDGENIFISNGDEITFDNGSRIRKGLTDAGNGGAKGVALVCSLDYELKWEAGRQYVMQQDGFTIREVSHNFTITPSATDDSTKGFAIDSRWILDNGDVYVCTDATEDSAVWELQVTQVNSDWNATSGVAEILNKPTIPDVTGFVPYTGANANVDLGENGLKAGQLTLDITPTGTAEVGTTRWNDTIGSSETTLKGGNVILKNGVDLVARIVNKVTPNTTLTKASYQVVRISGAQGQRLAVNLAQANNDNNSADTLGVVCETIATNQQGFIMTVGQLENINTTGSLQGETWSDGDVLYLSPTTAGRLTNVKPIAPAHIVIVGYVEYAHANNGKIYVKIMNGWELDELHNVAISTPLNNQGLIYETSTDLWKNKTIIEDSITNGVTTIAPSQNAVFNALATKQNILTNPITGTGTSGQVAFFNGATTQAADNGLFWDNTNKRLGVGTTTPSTLLNLYGSSGIMVDWNNTGSGKRTALTGRILGVTRWELSTIGVDDFAIDVNGSERMRITDNGSVGIGTTTPTTRLDVRAQGALSTDIAFRVRNSADTANLIQVNGLGGVEINSTTQGVLFPRMTTTQKNAIVSPASGLVIYDTTLNKLCVRGASAWETITSI
jgi:nitrogen fixation protein